MNVVGFGLLKELKARLSKLPRCSCRDPYCVLAGEAVRLQKAKGFSVARLEDGVPEWRAQGLVTVGEELRLVRHGILDSMRIENPRLVGRMIPCVTVALMAAVAAPAFAQNEVQLVLKHLKTSRDFTMKVADQMPAADYVFKLTPPQMSFAEQLVHLTQGLDEYIAPFSGQKPNPAKPTSMSKKDVMAFVGKSFDEVIAKVSKLTPAQLSKTYASEEGNMTGLELLMGMLDHTTHHRASAEMYLRAKSLTPVEYEF